MIEATKQCEGQVVDNFPLRQCLGETGNSTVFLTERQGNKAAIKFIAAEGDAATKQLSAWMRASQLPHPHLLRIISTGRCQLGGRSQIYAVMDFAEENLAEILPHRALTTAEAGEMLGPLLSALQYLHGNGFVHGRLRPANIMAADNQLKLASDTVRQAGNAYSAGKERTAYDPPEVGTSTLSPSADVWALGITLVEVLTQKQPARTTPTGEPVVPASLPEPFGEIARNCLVQDPNARWTVPQIQARLNRIQQLPERPATPTQDPATRTRSLKPWVVAILILLVVAGGIALLRKKPVSQSSSSPATVHPKNQAPDVPAKPPAAQEEQASNPGANTSDAEIVRQVLPDLPVSARHTISGRIKLRVRVHVNSAGDVTRADLVSAGPSQYFARKVMEAARQWKFAANNAARERRWMLHFDLTRKGTSVHAQKVS